MGCKSSDKPKQKIKHRKGLWSPEEDERLKDYVLQHGHGCWSSVPINAGLERNGKSCRLRWINYLRPGLKRGAFSSEEEETVLALHRLLGNKWSQMAQHLPGRTDNEIKNYWHSYLKKRSIKIETKDQEAHRKSQICSSSSTRISSFEPFDPVQGSSTTDTNHSSGSTTPVYPPRSSLPKIIFAEWLSLDLMHGKNNYENTSNNLAAADQQPVVASKDVFEQSLNIQDPFMMPGFQIADGSFNDEFNYGPSEGGSFCNGLNNQDLSYCSGNEMFFSQFYLSDHIVHCQGNGLWG